MSGSCKKSLSDLEPIAQVEFISPRTDTGHETIRFNVYLDAIVSVNQVLR